MALFARRRPEIELLPVEGHDELALVSREHVEELLDALVARTLEYVDGEEPSRQVSGALATGVLRVAGLDAVPTEAAAGAESASRVGYLARVAEWERVATARKPEGWMSAELRGVVASSVAEELSERGPEASLYDALAAVTAFFVSREALDVPYDAEQGFRPMWTIPGMGGEFRALLRDQTLVIAIEGRAGQPSASARPTAGASFEELQLAWKYGFLLRAFEEFFRRP